MRVNKEFYDVDEIFTSKTMIKKDTTPIKLEVVDGNGGDQIKTYSLARVGLRIEGTVESLMDDPYYCAPGELDNNKNCLEVVALWQPERLEGLKKNN